MTSVNNNNEIKYVSWRALVATVSATTGTCLLVTFFMIQIFMTSLDKKLDKELFYQNVRAVQEQASLIADRQSRANERARRMEILVERIATKMNISSYVPVSDIDK